MPEASQSRHILWKVEAHDLRSNKKTLKRAQFFAEMTKPIVFVILSAFFYMLP